MITETSYHTLHTMKELSALQGAIDMMKQCISEE